MEQIEQGPTGANAFSYAPNLNTFAPPNDKALQLAEKVSKPSYEALTLKSELQRNIYPEKFIHTRNLGTLADLSVRSLGRKYGAQSVPVFAKDAVKLRILYDSIDIESPLEKLYTIKDNEFWKRLVLAKTKDKSLKFMKDTFDWKSLGVSLKYAEMVEDCPAEFWPTQKMESLATLVKEFVKELHINKLRSLQDYRFQKYQHRDSDTDKSDSTDVSSTTSEEEEEEPIPPSEGEEGEEEHVPDLKAGGDAGQIISAATSEAHIGFDDGTGDQLMSDLAKLQTEWDAFEARRAVEKARVIEERRQARRARREAQQRRRDLREEKQRLRKEQQAQAMKKKKAVIVKDVFGLPIDDPEDDEDKKIDRRNPNRMLRLLKDYEYPAKHCHHIDLSFVRLFDNLNEFSIQFHPPPLHDKYHTRHFNFSYHDVERLADGIKNLQLLRIFRLRDSRMDECKLHKLTNVLKNLNVEVVDFSYDELRDDCDDAIYELFQNTTTIKSLELEGNFFDVNVLRRLSMALRKYEGALEYLGLARNPLSDEALHALCFVLHNTAQIQELCLVGIQLSQNAIICCIANELLRKHKILKKLELYGMSISDEAATEILKALKENKTILELDCRGCDLYFQKEFEIEVCLRRNRYIKENPYLEDPTQTEEQIMAYCGRLKNRVLIEAIEEKDKIEKCYEYRPDIAERFSLASIDSANVRKHSESISDLLFPFEKRPTPVEASKHSSLQEEEVKAFNYNPNKFNLEEIQQHVLVPGANQRYYYFKDRKERSSCSKTDFD